MNDSPLPLDPEPRFPNRKRRNAALMIALVLFIVLIYAVTIVKIKLGYGP